MKLGIINSAFQQAGVDTQTGLEHISRIGFDCVDIFTEAMTISQNEIDLIRRTCDANNLPIVSTVVVSAGLIDFNDPVREFHVQRTRKFLDLAQTFQSDNLLLVIGEYIWQREVIPPEAQWAWGVECVRELGLYAGERSSEVNIVLFPPFPLISAMIASGVTTGTQTVSENTPGAFTGEVDAQLVKQLGAKYVLVGHSERRSIYKESNDTVAAKFARAQQVGLTPILCVGESETEQENGKTEQVVAAQIDAVINKLGVAALKLLKLIRAPYYLKVSLFGLSHYSYIKTWHY